MSKNALKKETLLILVQGAGDARAGEWSATLCIKEGLNVGSMIPSITRALDNEYGVIVTNPNVQGTEERNPGRDYTSIKHAAFKEHLLRLWDNYITKSVAKKIYFIAHSFGGLALLHLLQLRSDDFLDRVTGIAFADSVHTLENLNQAQLSYLKTRAIQWCSSKQPLAEKLSTGDKKFGCKCVSAGTEEHERTTPSALNEIFEFIEQRDGKKWDTRTLALFGICTAIVTVIAIRYITSKQTK